MDDMAEVGVSISNNKHQHGPYVQKLFLVRDKKQKFIHKMKKRFENVSRINDK